VVQSFLLASAVLLAACTTVPPQKQPDAPRKPSYYSDDGPPDSIPADLASVPDAVPRDEPFHKFANRPYTVFGRSYAPVVNKEPTRERGMASWYGKKFHGQKTSSGEIYDMFAMTAAHKTLPIPSYAKVTNVRNGKSVVVRVNDRGPFHGDRIIDLSYAAADRIGIASAGSGLVEVERVFETPVAMAARATPLDRAPLVQPLAIQPAVIETPVVAPESGALWLQLGAFAGVDNAETFRVRMARELSWNREPLSIAQRDGLHRVRLGPYRNREEALAVADKVRETLGYSPALSTH
jgi:rare lipoprotein A